MKDGFEERKKKNEEKWAHDAELRFKTLARRNKLFGRWAAGELGLTDEAAEDYAKAVVTAEFHAPGGDILRKVTEDFRAAGLTHAEDVLRRKLEALAALAQEQIRSGKP